MKRLIYGIFTVLLLGILLTGCSVEVQEDQDKNNTAQYYLYDINGDETALVREAYTPEESTAEYMLKDMMQRMNNKESGKEAISLLPDELQMNYSVEAPVLVVNFNSSYKDMSAAREILVRAGVVKSFLQVPGITAVRFTVENEELLDSRGNPVGDMTEDTFAEFTGNEPDAYCSNTFTLYFTDKEGTHLVKEQRTVRYKRTIPRERIILEQLMKGPMEKGHYPTIPENTELLNVTIADGVCYVAFDQVFSSYALDVSEKIPVYSVVNSLLDAVDADKVQITVGEKEKLDTFGQKMALYRFYERNDKLVVAIAICHLVRQIQLDIAAAVVLDAAACLRGIELCHAAAAGAAGEAVDDVVIERVAVDGLTAAIAVEADVAAVGRLELHR